MKLSIITINYNNAEGLRKTLASVDVQTYRDIEHIIIDAASSDGSVDVIKGYADSSKHTVIWSSKKDNGIYDGMNSGIKKATGDYVWILNSGDCAAAPDVVERMMALLNDGKYDILIGNKVNVYDEAKKDEPKDILNSIPRAIETSMLTFYSGTVPQDAAFVRRELFEKYGYFDDKLKIVSDWKLYLNMIALGNVNPMYVNIDVVLFDMTGISNTNMECRNAEKRAYLEEVLPASILKDYDAYAFPIHQYLRLKKHHLWGLVFFLERVLFKLEKWHILR
jgi:glycosyltransferase involved in cell wall biosynthesis